MATTAAAAATLAAPSRQGQLGKMLGWGSLARNQLETLQALVAKHLTDPALVEISSTQDFALTSLERGIPRYEHAHLVAALDTLLTYQRDRRGKSCGISFNRSYKHDPRTRFVELLKRWLRTNACNTNIGEEDVRRMCSLCRDVLNYPRLFPSKNSRSFLRTLAEVYGHLQLQLKEVLKRDRTCAELAAQALSTSRNLISDSIAFLLLAATDLKQTDKLPSLEVVALWQSLPETGNPLPARADPEMQKIMKVAWKTLCGSLVAGLLMMPWAFRLFGGASAQDEAAASAGGASSVADKAGLKAIADRPAPRRGTGRRSLSPSEAREVAAAEETATPQGRRRLASPLRRMMGAAGGGSSPKGEARSSSQHRGRSVASTGGEEEEIEEGPPVEGIPALLEYVEAEFDRGRFGSSGLAGPFREANQKAVRMSYLAAVEAVYDLVYLLGEVLVHFQRISEGLGDYGMIRVAPWLHPFLEALVQKAQTLKACLEAVNSAVDQELVIAKARGRAIKKPAPSELQSSRAHAAIERAVTGRDGHVQSLLQVLEDLRARSAPERLPQLMDSLGDACNQLQSVLNSPQFLACVGDDFPTLPPLGPQAQAQQPGRPSALAGGAPQLRLTDSARSSVSTAGGGQVKLLQ